MKILVTGGAGFIGSHLTAALIDADHDVVVLDDLSSGRRGNLAGIDARLVVGNVADATAVDHAIADCDLVFHLAALVSVPRSLAEPTLNHASNVTGTFNVFDAARRAGVKRVVYASSSAVYGDIVDLPCRENGAVAPISPYGAAKLMGEQYAQAFAVAYGMEFVGLRFMNVFGPRQDPSSPYSGVLSIFCRAALSGETCHVYGDGEQTRDFVYVDDVVRALRLAAAATLPEPKAVVNIGRGEATTLNDILRLLRSLTPGEVTAVYEAERPGDIRHSFADITLAQRLLGYQPTTSLADGLAETLAWAIGNKLESQ